MDCTLRFLARASLKQSSSCSYGLSKTFVKSGTYFLSTNSII